NIIKRIPLVGAALTGFYKRYIDPSTPFSSSEKYWIDRYREGGNSGDGSYGKLAEFKAEVINRFVSEQQISTIVEFGCGDGNQLEMASYPSYLGFDVSQGAIDLCKSKFSDDASKDFFLTDEYVDQVAELAMSLDVVFHLVEDDVFGLYMSRLFESSSKFVIVFSSNTDDNMNEMAEHVKHRHFTKWIDSNQPEWTLLKHLPNRYPWDGDTKTGSFADFYIFQKSAHG
ncbi:class I SAM-dependent methyltransferase, partial [Verrucomicrobiales bacterium]|nr:class I SAM-dependent methyltransferase [Verrucomicrobiales bacterium]